MIVLKAAGPLLVATVLLLLWWPEPRQRVRRAVARFVQVGPQRDPSPAHPAWDAHVDSALDLTHTYPPGGDWDRWEAELAATPQPRRPR